MVQKRRSNVIYVQHNLQLINKHSTTAKYCLLDLHGNTQLKSNLTEVLLDTYDLSLVQLCLMDCCLTLRNEVSKIN